MKKLTLHQENWLLTFFVHDRYPGWRNIATLLINTGTCIVAGSTCIWEHYDIGTYIELEPVPKDSGVVGCIQYNFDRVSFLNSLPYTTALDKRSNELLEQLTAQKLQVQEISEKLEDIQLINN
jgi:hypothetical protein